MSSNSLENRTLDRIANSLAEILVIEYGYNQEQIIGDALGPTLDHMTSRLESQLLGFRDAKRLLAGILRPYLGTTVAPMLQASPAVKHFHLGSTAISLNEVQSTCLLALITQVFVTFIHGVTAKLKRGGVAVHNVPRSIMTLYTWRAMADLAKQAKVVLSDLISDHDVDALSHRVKPSDSLIIERMLRTVVEVDDSKREEPPVIISSRQSSHTMAIYKLARQVGT
ncbi:hypothetical protein PoB_000408500 [Plakobranchus ocellatus]|uniref:Uncharacterized protein n=1 Tax=Plakobranchus ocellatus TaxID=259542 RepID=A0AAV3Y412_9GAST|nr:hypothetical protein PoB_000408500 [Plakobranchus ocellatus]